MLSDIINQNSEFMRKIKCDYHYVDNLVARYEEEGGYAIQLNEGSLASGDWILYDDTGKLKCFYIYEEALSSWASCQIVQVDRCLYRFRNEHKKMWESCCVYA